MLTCERKKSIFTVEEKNKFLAQPLCIIFVAVFSQKAFVQLCSFSRHNHEQVQSYTAVRFEKLRIWAILNNTCGCEQFLNKAQAEIPLAQCPLIIPRLSKYLWILQAVQTLFASRQRTTLARLLLGCRHLLQAEVEECDIPGTGYLPGFMFCVYQPHLPNTTQTIPCRVPDEVTLLAFQHW